MQSEQQEKLVNDGDVLRLYADELGKVLARIPKEMVYHERCITFSGKTIRQFVTSEIPEDKVRPVLTLISMGSTKHLEEIEAEVGGWLRVYAIGVWKCIDCLTDLCALAAGVAESGESDTAAKVSLAFLSALSLLETAIEHRLGFDGAKWSRDEAEELLTVKLHPEIHERQGRWIARVRTAIGQKEKAA